MHIYQCSMRYTRVLSPHVLSEGTETGSWEIVARVDHVDHVMADDEDAHAHNGMLDFVSQDRVQRPFSSQICSKSYQ